MDSIFLLTVGFIFLGALFSNVMKWRNKDRVLKDLQEFQTTIEMQGGKKIWGTTQIYNNGMELYFSKSSTNSSGDPIASYIFYRDDIDKIRAIYRSHGELSKEKQLIRENEVAIVSSPDFFHIFRRKTRIFFNMFNDAIGEALSVFLSRMKGSGGAANPVFTTQSDYLKKMGTTALSAAGNSYDPILEKYINCRVVVALKEDNSHEEFCGFLKEYSSAWISVLDCKLIHVDQIDLDDLVRLSLQRDMDFSYYLYEEEGDLVLDVLLAYFGSEPLKVLSVIGGDDDKDVSDKTKDYHHKINKTLKRGESISFTLSKLPQESFASLNRELLPMEFEMISEDRRDYDIPAENEVYQSVLPEIKLEFESTRIADVYLPRTLAVLRHGAE